MPDQAWCRTPRGPSAASSVTAVVRIRAVVSGAGGACPPAASAYVSAQPATLPADATVTSATARRQGIRANKKTPTATSGTNGQDTASATAHKKTSSNPVGDDASRRTVDPRCESGLATGAANSAATASRAAPCSAPDSGAPTRTSTA